MRVHVVWSGDLERRFREGSERADRIVQAGLSHIGHEMVQAAQQIAKAGPYGRSFKVVPHPRGVEAGSSSPMAAVLERGRRPGRRPPPQSIRKRSGGSFAAAERAADRIEHVGTRGRWVVKRANAQIKRDGTMTRIAREALEAIARG